MERRKLIDNPVAQFSAIDLQICGDVSYVIHEQETSNWQRCSDFAPPHNFLLYAGSRANRRVAMLVDQLN